METPSKEQVIKDLEKSFQDMVDWVNAQLEENVNAELVPGKWTIAGHIYHLIKSTKAVTQGMGTPKMVLKTMFGTCNRPERTYEEMREKYTTGLVEKKVKAPNKYAAEPGRVFEREALLKRFEGEGKDFIDAFNKWKEADLAKFVLPHPVLGKCTLREFGYFTTIHTYHHLNILKEKYVVG